MSNDDNALQPVRNNIHGNGLWARIREHTSNVLSPSREGVADKENVYPELSQGKDIEEERAKVRQKENAHTYEHVENEEEDDDEHYESANFDDGSIYGSNDIDDTQEESPFVRGAGRTQAARHREAYVEMTALAVPLPDVEDLTRSFPVSMPATPAHKRRRIEEIVESDALSDEEQGSSVRRGSAPSIPKHSPKRLCVIGSTIHDDSIGDNYEDSVLGGEEDTTMDGGTLGDSSRSSPPSAIHPVDPNQQLVDRLLLEFPGHGFGVEGDKIRCYDCDKLIVQVGEYFVRRHLQSKGHTQANELRRAKDEAMNIAAPQKINARGQSLNQQNAQKSPVPIYSTNGETTLSQARDHYLAMLENETVAANIRTNMLNQSIETVDVKSNNRAEELKSQIESLEQRVVHENQQLKRNQDKHDQMFENASQQCRGTENKANGKFDSIDEQLARLKSSMKNFEDTVRNVKKVALESEEKNGVFRHEIDHRVANFSGILAKNKLDTKDELDIIRERISKLKKNEIKPVKFEEICNGLVASRFQIGELEARFRELKDASGSWENLGAKTTLQEERTDGLEMSVQVMTEQMKSFQQALSQSEGDLVDTRKQLLQARENIEGVKVQVQERKDYIEKTLDNRLQQMRSDVDMKLATEQTQFQEDLAGLIDFLEEQKNTINQQDVKLKSHSLMLKRQEALLGEFDTTLQNQNKIINMLTEDLVANDSRMKQEGKQLKIQAIVIEHLKNTIPGFMKDLRTVDDKIEDYIEEQIERERGRKAPDIVKSQESHSRDIKPFSIVSSQPRCFRRRRKVRFIPRFRR